MAFGNCFGQCVVFFGNRAVGNGGALRALANIRLLNGPSFLNNTAGGGTTADGGAIFAGNTVFLSSSTSSNNRARNGGAVYAVSDITFKRARYRQQPGCPKWRLWPTR